MLKELTVEVQKVAGHLLRRQLPPAELLKLHILTSWDYSCGVERGKVPPHDSKGAFDEANCRLMMEYTSGSQMFVEVMMVAIG